MNNEKIKKMSERNKKYDLEERLIQFTLLIIDINIFHFLFSVIH